MHLLTLTIGKSGSGKSTLVRHQARHHRRLLAHDPNGEAIYPDQGWIATADRAELVELLSDPRACRVAWRGAMMTDDEGARVEAFEFANRCAWAAGSLAVIWDEVDMFTRRGQLPPVGYRIVNAGRHRGLVVYACTRRPYDVPRSLSAAATRVCCFRITEPRDVAYVRSIAGPAADRLPTLPRLHALDWTEYGARFRLAPFD